jgi:drug/metabolite transporter (DMT)-like permease
MGLLLCLLGALVFGLLACVSKIAEERGCTASGLVVSLFGWAALAMLLRATSLHSGSPISLKVVAIGSACGICAAVSYFAFQTSIKIGQVTVGWLMMNVSAGVPAAVSIWVYKEKMTPTKILAFALGLVSVLCLFGGQRLEDREAVKVDVEEDKTACGSC